MISIKSQKDIHINNNFLTNSKLKPDNTLMTRNNNDDIGETGGTTSIFKSSDSYPLINKGIKNSHNAIYSFLKNDFGFINHTSTPIKKDPIKIITNNPKFFK